MSITRQSANIVSKAHLGDVTIPANRNRSYFEVIVGDTAGSLYLGGGDGEIPLAATTHYEPRVCPTGEIRIVNAGVYTVVMG